MKLNVRTVAVRDPHSELVEEYREALGSSLFIVFGGDLPECARTDPDHTDTRHPVVPAINRGQIGNRGNTPSLAPRKMQVGDGRNSLEGLPDIAVLRKVAACQRLFCSEKYRARGIQNREAAQVGIAPQPRIEYSAHRRRQLLAGRSRQLSVAHDIGQYGQTRGGTTVAVIKSIELPCYLVTPRSQQRAGVVQDCFPRMIKLDGPHDCQGQHRRQEQQQYNLEAQRPVLHFGQRLHAFLLFHATLGFC